MSELETELETLLNDFESRVEDNERKAERFEGESLEHMYRGIAIGRARCISELIEVLEEYE